MDFIENIRDIHIGRIIQGKLTEKAMSKTEFADKINKTRPDVNDIFSRKTISIELLIDISKALDYDFIRNVYYKKQKLPSISISIKTEENLQEKLNLPEEFICFVERQK